MTKFHRVTSRRSGRVRGSLAGGLLVSLAACAGPLVASGTAPVPVPVLPGVPASPAVEAPAAPATPPNPAGSGVAAVNVEVTSVEFRPADHPEDAAVRYQLSLTAAGSSPVTVSLNHSEILAVPVGGSGSLTDFWVQWAAGAPGCPPGAKLPDFALRTSTVLTVMPGAPQSFVGFLNPADAEPDCARGGRARGRVDPAVSQVELTLPGLAGPAQPPARVTIERP
ncbi:MAG: hypothetical protein ACT4OS_05250 [Acidimicrobiales bacterium]